MAKQKFVTSWDDVPVMFDLAYASILTGLTVSSLQKKAKNGELPAFRIGKVWRIDKNKFIEYLNNQKGAQYET